MFDDYNHEKINQVFETSHEPKSIYHYECFYDLANGWVTGNELAVNWGVWNENIKSRWHYFYRPYKFDRRIGKKQYELIDRGEDYISQKQGEKNIVIILIFAFAILTIFLALWLSEDIFQLAFIPALLVLGLSAKALIVAHEIESKKNEVFLLREEISDLEHQCEFIWSNMLCATLISNNFWDDISELEKDIIENVLKIPRGLEAQNEVSFYDNFKASPEYKNNKFPKYPVVPTWGILQSHQDDLSDSFKYGAKKVIDSLGQRAATWQTVGVEDNEPFYRLWYISFLIFNLKSLNVVSFHYDFVTKRQFGNNAETYYYNHIAHCTYEIYEVYDIDKVKNNIIVEEINTPKDFLLKIFQGEFRRLAFSSSSMRFYECILPSDDNADILQNHKIEDNKQVFYGNSINYNKLYNGLADESFKVLREKVDQFTINERVFRATADF